MDQMKQALCVALDGSDRRWIVETAAQLAEAVGWLKIGLEAFTAFGPDLVREVVGMGPKVFLDLKLHDIPNTVRGAARNCAGSGAAMFNVHASGGRAMMEAAAAGVREADVDEPPQVIAVTVLTSIGDGEMDELGINGSPREAVQRLARLARDCSLDGVVASAHEVEGIRAEVARDFKVVTPGIRPSWSANDDQRRVVTPRQAIALGVDVVVIGRPITRAPSPAEAVARVLREMAGSPELTASVSSE